MIIGIDAGCLAVEDLNLKAGVYYVVYNLLIELAKIDNQNIYYLYSFSPINNLLMERFPKNSKNIVLPSFAWLYLSLPLSFVKKKPDVFLATSQAMPIYHPFKTIGIIHGLDFMPEFHPGSNRKLKKNSEYIINHANVIITTSLFLKKTLEKVYLAKNVVVASLGVNKIFFNKIKPYILDKPYFLFVGSFKPSKNIPNLLKAFSIFLRHTKKDYKMLLIGSNFWWDKNIEVVIRNEKLEKNVAIIPSVENSELPKYYKGAVAFISPSLYEAFGMTFLEAMAAGCPVIGSNIGGIPEIVDSAGILVNPKNLNNIAQSIKKMTNQNARKGFIKMGRKRAEQYSWEKFAKSIYNIIQTYGK